MSSSIICRLQLEQRLDPTLLDAAVILSGIAWKPDVVLDASLLAIGVSPGMSMRQAEQLYPLGSTEAEVYFTELLTKYDGPQDETSLGDWLSRQIAEQFVSITDKPRWIQHPEWQFTNGSPMVFAGQIDISQKSFPAFHDDTSLYVFIGQKVESKVVMQQY